MEGFTVFDKAGSWVDFAVSYWLTCRLALLGSLHIQTYDINSINTNDGLLGTAIDSDTVDGDEF